MGRRVYETKLGSKGDINKRVQTQQRQRLKKIRLKIQIF